MNPTLKTCVQAYAIGTIAIGIALTSTLPSVNDNKVTRFVMNLFAARSTAETSSNTSLEESSKPQCINNLGWLLTQKIKSAGNTSAIDSLIKSALLSAYREAENSRDGVIVAHLADLLNISVQEVRVQMERALEASLPMAVLVSPLGNYDPELQ